MPNYDYRERCWKCLAPIASLQPVAAPPLPDPTPPPSPAPAEVAEAKPASMTPANEPPYSPAISTAQQQAEDEVRKLSEAIDGGSPDEESYELRATYLIELERWDEAQDDISKLSPSTRRDLLQADVAAGKGDLREACDLYETVLAAEPNRTGAARRLARLYVRQGAFNPDEVNFVRDTLDTQFDRLAGSSDWVPWITFLHERYSAAGRWDEELTMLRRVVEKNPLNSNPRLALWMVDALIESGATDEALDRLHETLLEKRNPAAVTAYRHAARALVQLGNHAAAKDLYQRLAEATGDDAASEMAAMLERAPDDQRFVPLEKLGMGAVAEVWRAFDLFSGERVGLKILHESLSGDTTAVRELRQEYEVMAASLSPRLARVIPGTLQDDRFAMDLLDRSLVDLLGEPAHVEGLPLRRAIEIAQQIAEGIEYLHARGFVYQDLSPQNILFRGNDVKLCDLGGLKAVDEQTSNPDAAPNETIEAAAPDRAAQSRASLTVAKVAYASPEQCSLLMGEAIASVDRRSDIYSLGIVLYQMVTGRLPFEGPDQAVLHAHLYSTPVAPLIHRPAVGRALNDVILRCMARAPDQRYATAAELWEALDQVAVDH